MIQRNRNGFLEACWTYAPLVRLERISKSAGRISKRRGWGKRDYRQWCPARIFSQSFNLPCRYVLHTVGPIVHGQLTEQHCRQLADCYRSCLELATSNGIKIIAFCCISTGKFHFPQKKAAEIAVQTVLEFLQTDTQIEKVIFNVFKQEDFDIYKSILYVWVFRRFRIWCS